MSFNDWILRQFKVKGKFVCLALFSKREDEPFLQPRQVAGALTLNGGECLAELVIREPLQFTVGHASKANH